MGGPLGGPFGVVFVGRLVGGLVGGFFGGFFGLFFGLFLGGSGPGLDDCKPKRLRVSISDRSVLDPISNASTTLLAESPISSKPRSLRYITESKFSATSGSGRSTKC